MSGSKNKQDREEELFEKLKEGKPLKYKDVRNILNSHKLFSELLDMGKIERITGGLYSLPERDSTWEMFSTITVMSNSKAIICMDSAASYHGLTTSNPHTLHAAFPYNSSAPKNHELNLSGYRWVDKSMTIGIEEITIGDVQVKITSPARTVFDLFRYVGKTGDNEQALEALASFQGRQSEILKIAREFSHAAEERLRPLLSAMTVRRKP